MTRTAEALHSLEVTVERYIAVLEQLSMEQLLAKPSEEEWSIGQMYMHLIQTARFRHLPFVEQCLAGGEGVLQAAGEKTERGQLAFEVSSYPPIRISVPASPEYTPQQPDSKEQLIEALHIVVDQMRRTEGLLAEAPAGNTLPHPGFGALNATEWFLLIDMHYRHHLLQLGRLQEFLKSSAV